MDYDFAVCGAWREYGEVYYNTVEVFATEDEAWANVDRIADENRTNTMYDWYAVREV